MPRPKTKLLKPTHRNKKSQEKRAKKIVLVKDPNVKVGRPTYYDPARHPIWAEGLCSHGATVQDLCDAMGISHDTLYTWRDKYPEFATALSVGRLETVARIRKAMARKAEGFVEPLEDREVKRVGDTETVRITHRQVHYPPDPSAAKILLVNLDPAFKTDKTALELTGKDGGAIQFAGMTDEEITKLAVLSLKKLQEAHEPAAKD